MWPRLPARLLAVLGLLLFLVIMDSEPNLSLGVPASLVRGLGLKRPIPSMRLGAWGSCVSFSSSKVTSLSLRIGLLNVVVVLFLCFPNGVVVIGDSFL